MDLFQKHSGPLTVVIKTAEGEHSFALNFTDATLFQYIGEACARIFTNLTTQLSVRIHPEDWAITEFSPEEQRLEAFQIGGEPLRIEEDDPERLSRFF